MREMRREAARRARRIIFNNDGDDAVYECDEPTPENLLAQRTSRVPGHSDMAGSCPGAGRPRLCSSLSHPKQQRSSPGGVTTRYRP